MSSANQANYADGEMERAAQNQADPQSSVYSPDCTNDGSFFSCTVAYDRRPSPRDRDSRTRDPSGSGRQLSWVRALSTGLR
jgi:hypothetical protein